MDLTITSFLYGLAVSSPTIRSIVVFCATTLILPIAAFAIFRILDAGTPSRRRYLAELVVTIALAYAVSQVIGIVAFRERPFVHHPGIRALVVKSPSSKSMPSDHATLAFALALPAAASIGRRWLRAVLILAAVAVAIGRVAAGVHYPSDVIAGAALAAAVWLLTHAIVRRVVPGMKTPPLVAGGGTAG